MDKVTTYAAVLSGIFIAVFVITFLWGVGKRILRWTVIAVVAYVGIVIAVRTAHLGGEGTEITMNNLLSMSVSAFCLLGVSTAAPGVCASSTK
jgi:hypothetical protein